MGQAPSAGAHQSMAYQQRAAGGYPPRTAHQGYGAQVQMAASNTGGPLQVIDPNTVWDEARGGYWIREIDTDLINGQSEGGAYIMQPPGGKIIKKTEWCEDDDEPVMIRRIKKKKIVESDSEDETTIITPPPIYLPPPQIYLMCPPAPQPMGKSSFFPLVRSTPFQLETQQKSAGVAEASCSGGCSGGPCGGFRWG